MDEEQEKRVKLQNKRQETELMFEMTTLKEQIERYKTENLKIEKQIEKDQKQTETDIKLWDQNIQAKNKLNEQIVEEIKEQEEQIAFQQERKIKIEEVNKINLKELDDYYYKIIEDLKQQIQNIRDKDFLRYQFNSEIKSKLEQEIDQLQSEILDVKNQKEEEQQQIIEEHRRRIEEITKNSNQEILDTKNRLLALQQDELDPIIKVNVLQNHQLTTELQYQQNQYQIITETNKELQQEVEKLKRELKIHEEVENELSHKTVQQKKLVKEMKELKQRQLDITQNLQKDINSQKSINESLLNQVSRNQANKNFKFKKLNMKSRNSSNSQSFHSQNQNQQKNQNSEQEQIQLTIKNTKNTSRFNTNNQDKSSSQIDNQKSIVDIYNESIILYKDAEQFKKVQETMASFIKRYMSKNNKFSKDWQESQKINRHYQNKLKQQKRKNNLFYNLIDSVHKNYQFIYHKNLKEMGITPQQITSRNTQQNQKTEQDDIHEEDQQELEDTDLYLKVSEIKTTDVIQWTFQQKIAFFNILKVQAERLKEELLQTQIEEEPNEDDPSNYEQVQMQVKIIDEKPEPLLTNKKFRLSKQQKTKPRFQSTPQLLKPFKVDSEYGLLQQQKQEQIKHSVKDNIQQLKYERFLNRLPRNNSISSQRYDSFNMPPNYEDSMLNQSMISVQKKLNSISSIQNSIIKNTQDLNISSKEASILNQQSIINYKKPGQILEDQIHDFNFLESELLNTKDNMERIKKQFKQTLKEWKNKIENEFQHEEQNQDLKEILEKILQQEKQEEEQQEKQENQNKQQDSNILDDLKSPEKFQKPQEEEDSEIIKILN